MSQGRSITLEQETILKQFDKALTEVVTSLDEQNLEQDITKLHKQDIIQLYDYLFLLKFDSLMKLYADISIGTSYQQETKRNIFLELLPQVGTDDSVRFVKELIVKRELKDLISIKMLSVYPFYLKQYSTELLGEMEALLNLGDNYDSKIRYTAILSFATLVYQTYNSGQASIETLEDYSLKYWNWFAGD